MDPDSVARIIDAHRPTVKVRACTVEIACTCGAIIFPCPVLIAATVAVPRPRTARRSR